MVLPPRLIDELYEIANNYFKQIGFINEDLKSRCRKRSLSDARLIYCNIIRTKTTYSTSVIGGSIDRDHSTVLHLCNNKSIIFSDKLLAKMLIELQHLILLKLGSVETIYKKREQELLTLLYHNCI